jgi:hypothetical protein
MPLFWRGALPGLVTANHQMRGTVRKYVNLAGITIVGSVLGVTVGCAQEAPSYQDAPPSKLSSQPSTVDATYHAPRVAALRGLAMPATQRRGVVATAATGGRHMQKAQSTNCLIASAGPGERPVGQTSCVPSVDQEWEFVFPFDDDRLQIRNPARNQCIVTRGTTESKAVTTTCNSAFADQLWTSEWDVDFVGTKFRNVNSGLCLVARTNAQAVQTGCAAFSDQVWQIHRVPSDYDITMTEGFGTTPPFAQRVVANLGAIPGHNEVISMRWFIPSLTAAGGTLIGDNRTFDSSPDAPEHSRAILTYNTQTGQASFTINPSTLLSGQKLEALPIRNFGHCAEVQSTDLTKRSTNDVHIGAVTHGIEFCVSLLNSLTNGVDIASWSVDVHGTLTLDEFDTWNVNLLGNGYPAIEVYDWTPELDGAGTIFLRQVDPFVSRDIDEGGGLAALDLESWFRCGQDATFENASVCHWDPSMVNPSRNHEFYFTPWF